MPTRRAPWTLRVVLIVLTLYATDFLLFGRMPTFYVHRMLRPDEWHGLLGPDKRVFVYLPLLVVGIVWAIRQQRRARGASSADGEVALRSPGAEVGRFPIAGLSIEEKLAREKTNGQVYLLAFAFAFVSYLLGVSLLGLKGPAALATTVPALALLAWQVKRASEPSEVVIGADGLALRSLGTERVLSLSRVESVESTKNARGDAVLVVVRHETGRSDDLLVGMLDGDRDRERTLVERADAIVACIESARAASYR